MLSNAYFLAKFRFDTAESELAKNLQIFANFPNFADPNPRIQERSKNRGPLYGFEAGQIPISRKMKIGQKVLFKFPEI